MAKLAWWAIVIAAVLVSCTDPADWEPKGEVRVVQFREAPQDANKVATLTPGKFGYGTASVTYWPNKEVGTLGSVTVDSTAFH